MPCHRHQLIVEELAYIMPLTADTYHRDTIIPVPSNLLQDSKSTVVNQLVHSLS